MSGQLLIFASCAITVLIGITLFIWPIALQYDTYMMFRAVIEFDPETKSYSAVCPELPGCASAGDTEAEARENIEEAICLYLEPAPLALFE